MLFALATPFCNGLFRRPSRSGAGDKPTSGSPFSIVITAHNQAGELERNLPILLSQDYPHGYEVIVVDESSTDSTDDVLKRLKAGHDNLYTTFIPSSSHYISRKKLAMTVGMKAARHEWIIFTDADCRPDSPSWLTAMAQHCGETTDMVLGYSHYESETPAFYRFERMLMSSYIFRTAQKKTAYRYTGNNLALRKSVFMAHNGFLKNLMFLRGEYDFMVNEYALPDRSAIAIEGDACVTQEAPGHKRWVNSHLSYMETRKHLKRSLPYRAVFNCDNALLHLNYVMETAATAYALMTDDRLVLIAAITSIVVTAAFRLAIAHKAMTFFGEKIPLLKVPFMEIRVAWQNLYFMIRHKFSDKYDFIRYN